MVPTRSHPIVSLTCFYTPSLHVVSPLNLASLQHHPSKTSRNLHHGSWPLSRRPTTPAVWSLALLLSQYSLASGSDCRPLGQLISPIPSSACIHTHTFTHTPLLSCPPLKPSADLDFCILSCLGKASVAPPRQGLSYKTCATLERLA